MEEGTYEVYFIAHKLVENAYVKVATHIPRDDTEIPSDVPTFEEGDAYPRTMIRGR